MAKRALITGVSGQDGAYLCELLVRKGYEVYGASRKSPSEPIQRLIEIGMDQEVQRVRLDLVDEAEVTRLVQEIKPDEIYNLAAQSFVPKSFEEPLCTGDVDALGVTRLLEAVRKVKPDIRFCQASSSAMYGKGIVSPQDEETPFHPRSPYGTSKLYGHWITVNYRESYGVHCSSAILFNHESPMRGLEAVTRKITSSLARVRAGHLDSVELGNISSRRDWGFAGDYVEGMWRMLQQDHPDDYVLATGEAHSVGEFAALAAHFAGFNVEWVGEEQNIEGIDRTSGKQIFQTNPAFYRPSEVDLLLGDAGKAKKHLGWTASLSFENLVEMMVKADIDRVNKGLP